MNSTTIAEKFAVVEKAIRKAKGEPALFALFALEYAPDRWDLVIAAPWAFADKDAALKYIVAQIRSQIGEQYLLELLRISIINPSHEDVESFNQTVKADRGIAEVRDTEFSGIEIRRGYVFRSRRPKRRAVKKTRRRDRSSRK
jgi:hypothetical protein